MARQTDGQRSTLRRALQLLTQEQGIWRSDLLDLLRTDLALLCNAWGINLDNGLDAARQTITASLHAHIAQLRPRPDHQPLSREDRDQQYKRGVAVSFNITPRQELRDMRLTDRRRWLADSARGDGRLSTRTSQRDLEHAITQIAAILGEVDYEPPVATDALSEKLDDSSLIDRDSYRGKVSGLVVAGKRLISIYGEPGTGKSTLAEMVANELAVGRPVITLHVADRKILQSDVLKALRFVGLSPEMWTEEACRVALQEQLSQRTDIGAVVVDNVTDATEDLTWQLIPERPVIPVILTSRKPPRYAAVAGVELGEFTEDEAQMFMARALPLCSDLDRRSLIAVLGRRPLVLFHSARFLANSDLVQPAELVAALSESITDSLNLIEPSLAQIPKLSRLYELILCEVTAEATMRDTLDTFIAATGNAALCHPRLLAFTMRAAFPSAAAHLRLQSGLNDLTRWGLLRTIDTQWGEYWSMHPLTWKVLRELRDEPLRATAVAYLESISDGEATRQDAQIPGPGRSEARLLYKELRAASNLYPGWAWLLSVDEWTWTACRDWPLEDGKTHKTYVRYDVLPNGVRRHDYTTGERGWVELQEAKQLARLVQLYGLVSNAAYRYVHDERLDPDAPDYGLQCLRAFLPNASAETLESIVILNKSQPIFYEYEAGSRALAQDATTRLGDQKDEHH